MGITALIVLALCALVYVVGGVFMGVPQKYLKPVLLGALLLVLVYLLWGLSWNLVGLCLLLALVLAARLMFARAP